MILRSGVAGRNIKDHNQKEKATGNPRKQGEPKVCRHGFVQPTEFIPKYFEDGSNPGWRMVTRIVAGQGCPVGG